MKMTIDHVIDNIASRFGVVMEVVADKDGWYLLRNLGEEDDFAAVNPTLFKKYVRRAYSPSYGFFPSHHTDHPEPPDHVKQFFAGIIKLLLP